MKNSSTHETWFSPAVETVERYKSSHGISEQLCSFLQPKDGEDEQAYLKRISRSRTFSQIDPEVRTFFLISYRIRQTERLINKKYTTLPFRC